MGVVGPWRRAPKSLSPIPRQKRNMLPVRRFSPLAIVGVLLALGLLIYCFALITRPTPLRTICEGERLLAYEPGSMVAEILGETFLAGASGVTSEFPGQVDQAIVAGGCAYALSGQALHRMGEGDTTFLCDVGPSERLIQVSGSTLALLARPREDGVFGEAWAMRALDHGGDVLWEATLPGVPIRAVVSEETFCVALRDVTVGLSSIAVLCPQTGRSLWSVDVGPGHWRDMCMSQDGRIAYATGEQAGVVESSGRHALVVLDKGHPTSITLWEGGLAVASVSGRRAVLWVIGADGHPNWSARLPSEATALSGDNDTLVALCQNHVIRFFLEDGRRETLITTEASTLWFRDGVLLVRSGSGVRIAEIEEDRKGRGPR